MEDESAPQKYVPPHLRRQQQVAEQESGGGGTSRGTTVPRSDGRGFRAMLPDVVPPSEDFTKASEEVLRPPSYEEIEHAEEYGTPEDKYQRLQQLREIFKKLPLIPSPRVVPGIPLIRDQPRYAAAGVFLWRINPKTGKAEVLMGWEDQWKGSGPAPGKRPNKGPGRGLTFLGGCRDDEGHHPREVAIREVMEESGGDTKVGESLRGLPAEALNLAGPAVWVDTAKYWVFLHQLPTGFPDPALRAFGQGNFSDEIVGLRWVDHTHFALKNGRMEGPFHTVAIQICAALRNNKAFPAAFGHP